VLLTGHNYRKLVEHLYSPTVINAFMLFGETGGGPLDDAYVSENGGTDAYIGLRVNGRIPVYVMLAIPAMICDEDVDKKCRRGGADAVSGTLPAYFNGVQLRPAGTGGAQEISRVQNEVPLYLLPHTWQGPGLKFPRCTLFLGENRRYPATKLGGIKKLYPLGAIRPIFMMCNRYLRRQVQNVFSSVLTKTVPCPALARIGGPIRFVGKATYNFMAP